MRCDLGAWKVMILSECRGISVQSGLAILARVEWEMREVEEPGFFKLLLLFFVGGIHYEKWEDGKGIS